MSMNVIINPYRARKFRDRVFASLSYHMRHRNPNGAREVLEIPKFQTEAGGKDQLVILIRSICVERIKHDAHKMEPRDRERWASWGMGLL